MGVFYTKLIFLVYARENIYVIYTLEIVVEEEEDDEGTQYQYKTTYIIPKSEDARNKNYTSKCYVRLYVFNILYR